jgi:hypothetical protein
MSTKTSQNGEINALKEIVIKGFTKLSTKIDQVDQKLDNLDLKIDQVETKLSTKIDQVEQKLSSDIEDLAGITAREFRKLETRRPSTKF